MSDIYQEALKLHGEVKGKLSIELKVPLERKEDLSLAYTPGVAQPCREIAKDKHKVYQYTWKNNSVAVVSDGTAVLGLGDIGPEAAMPVMEGKAILFKKFGGIDAVPICLDTKDPQEIISIVKAIAPSFGGINLEDISAPRCVEIERTLIKELDIPVFHDDQHGTAIVVTAGLINALKVVKKEIQDITVVVSGTGAAGSSIIKMIHQLGVKEIYGFNINGIVTKEDYDQYDFLTQELTEITNSQAERMTMAEALKKADVFIGVSAPKLLTKEMVQSMKKDPIVFAMANPEPEISYEEAIEAGVAVMGTGRSDYPNQINNVLAFPGLFRGALDARASSITEEMKLEAALGLASLVSEEELSPTYVIPDVLDPRVSDTVAKAVARKAKELGIIKNK
jgi:malate dehydrogenase (oxaloacetate-decarboxylating)